LEYIKQRHGVELSSFINIFEYYNNQGAKQTSEIYFHIYRQPEVKKAFFEYLEKVDRIENIEHFESEFNPKLAIISQVASIFSFGVSVSVTGLRPNRKYELLTERQ
jgi:uncharacterized UPF0160 family protein